MTQNFSFSAFAIKASRRNTQNFVLFQPRDMSKKFLHVTPPDGEAESARTRRKKKLDSKIRF